MGTTLTAVYVDERKLAVAHVGDSRAYLFRDGELGLLTQDHTLVGELVKRGKLTEEQAAEHPQRSIITRALGIDAEVEVDTWTYGARAGDIVLLCSDGLTSMIIEEQIAAVLSSETDLDAAADRLIDEANEAGGRDNITVILFTLEEVGGDGAGDEPTVIGHGARRTRRRRTAGTNAGRVGSHDRPRRHPALPRRRGRTVPTPRLARTQGRRRDSDTGARRRGPGRFTKPLAALLATVIVLFLIGGGGYLATRQLFFIGTNSRGS